MGQFYGYAGVPGTRLALFRGLLHGLEGLLPHSPVPCCGLLIKAVISPLRRGPGVQGKSYGHPLGDLWAQDSLPLFKGMVPGPYLGTPKVYLTP